METTEKNRYVLDPKPGVRSPFQSQLNFLHIILAVFRLSNSLFHERLLPARKCHDAT